MTSRADLKKRPLSAVALLLAVVILLALATMAVLAGVGYRAEDVMLAMPVISYALGDPVLFYPKLMA